MFMEANLDNFEPKNKFSQVLIAPAHTAEFYTCGINVLCINMF